MSQNAKFSSHINFSQDPLIDSEDETQNTLSTANTLMPDIDKKEIKRGPGLGGFMAVLSSTFKTIRNNSPIANWSHWGSQ